MNWLVYKQEKPDVDAGKKVSEILYNRLKPDTDEKYSDLSERSHITDLKYSRMSQSGGKRGMSYQEWLKSKDAERRLKRKLIQEAQAEVK